METHGTQLHHPLIRLAGVTFLISFCLGILPIFPSMLGFNFLPSYKWMSAARVFGQTSGLISALVFSWFGWKVRNKVPSSTSKKTLGFIALPFFGFFVGQNAVLVAPPMIAALVAGHQIETPFTLARANGYGASGCRSPVELRDLPFWFNKVCRVGSQFRNTVSPGTEVRVIGHGTDLGLFVEDIRRAS